MKRKRTLFVVVILIFGTAVNASVILRLETESTTPITTTGTNLDNGPNFDQISPAAPFTVQALEDLTGAPVTGLTISIISGSSFDPASTNANASNTSFGVNSPTPTTGSEEPTHFDVDAMESLTIAFNQSVFIEQFDFTSLSGDDAFTVGSITGINDTNTNINDIFDFTNGGVSNGIYLPKGSGLFLEATGPAGTSVGIEAIRIAVIPEPSGFLFLLCLGAFSLLIFRRKRKFSYTNSHTI